MQPRDKLKQCMRCRNNIECWGLNQNDPEGINPYDTHVKPISIIKNALKNTASNWKNMKVLHFVNGYHCVWMLKNLTRTEDLGTLQRAQNGLLVLNAMANTTENEWVCPDGYEFNPMKLEEIYNEI